MASFRKQPPANPELQRLRLHAQQLMQRKRHDLAEGVLNQILSTVPDDAQAYRQLALCMLVLRRPAEAIDHARRAVSLKPDSDSCLTTLGLILRSSGQNEEAITVYLQALQIKVDCAQAFTGLANLFAKSGTWEDALHWADKALSIKPNDPAMLRNRGEILAALGKPEEALLTMQEFLRLAPDEVLSQATAAAILRRLDRFDEAVPFAERALSMSPADPGLHNFLASLKLKARKLDDAHRHFSEAGEIYDSRPVGRRGSEKIVIHSLVGQAVAHIKRREFPEAEALYRRVLEINPDYVGANALLAGVIGAQHRYDEALQMARNTLERNPKLQRALNILAGLLYRMERFEEALAVARESLELNTEAPIPHQIFAGIYLEMEDFDKALESAQTALRIKQQPEAERLLARALAGLGRRDEAIASIDSALNQEPDSPSSHESAGLVFYFLENYENAASHFGRAGELDNGTNESLGWLGLVYFKQGKIYQALPMLQKSISINPYQRRVREALSEIETSCAGSANV